MGRGGARSTGERKYYLFNLPADADLHTLPSAVKARWSCEQAHQQLKEELGLDHFEGRSWTELHRHALLTMIAFVFLQQRRLEQAERGKKAAPHLRLSQACPPLGGPPSQPSCQRAHQPDARTAGAGSDHLLQQECQSSARLCLSLRGWSSVHSFRSPNVAVSASPKPFCNAGNGLVLLLR